MTPAPEPLVARPPRNRLPVAKSTVVAVILALPLALPILTIIALAFTADASDWPKLLSGVLPTMTLDTVLYCAGVSAGTLVVGTSLAFLITMFRFPGRNVLKWLAILPLAVPGYITAFAYVDTFSYAGSFQVMLRQTFGWTQPGDYHFPEIRSLGGAIFVMTAALYPYVYMSARAAFLKQSLSQLDAARTLGRSPWRAFVEITLPQTRPALAVGVSLVVMECLNDIGAVGFFGVNTLTYGIYTLWLGQGNLGAAAQLALVLLTAVIALILFEQMMRQRDELSRAAKGSAMLERRKLTGWQGLAAVLVTVAPIFAGFALPVLLLVGYAQHHWDSGLSANFLQAASNSVVLALLACLGTLTLALVFGYANRRSQSPVLASATGFAGLGYALPGTVLGIGVLVPLAHIDRLINAVSVAVFNWQPGLILSGSIAALVFAYVARFLAIALGSVEAGLLKVSPSLDEAARSLGRKPFTAFRDIHLPLLRPSLLTAALLVFVDAMKELPATLMLRPFDFDTLATHVFSLASLGQIEDSAVPALTIIAVGLLPVAILTRNVRDPGRV